MNHPANTPPPQPSADLAAVPSGTAEPATATAVPAAPPSAAPDPERAASGGTARRGGQRRRGRGEPDARRPAAAPGALPPARPRPRHPLLEQLAQWHPQLFGAQPLPLKRGIFHDLLATHGAAIAKDELKLALAQHTRSTRYLTAVASGQQRHDLSGQPVEAMAPEHVHHALLEVFRRRRPRDGEDVAGKLRRRIAQAFEASGLTRAAYDALVRGRDERANALLDEALAEVAERDARAEALAQAFEASGATPEAFADMYGMDRRQVTQQLARARRLRAAPTQPAVATDTADAAITADPAAPEAPSTDA